MPEVRCQKLNPDLLVESSSSVNRDLAFTDLQLVAATPQDWGNKIKKTDKKKPLFYFPFHNGDRFKERGFQRCVKSTDPQGDA